MDQNKLSSHDFLSLDFVDTPHGAVCRKSDAKCVRCRAVYSVTVPDNVIEKIDDESQTGTALVEYMLETSGWSQKVVTRKNGNKALYTICPNCIEKDFSFIEQP